MEAPKKWEIKHHKLSLNGTNKKEQKKWEKEKVKASSYYILF